LRPISATKTVRSKQCPCPLERRELIKDITYGQTKYIASPLIPYIQAWTWDGPWCLNNVAIKMHAQYYLRSIAGYSWVLRTVPQVYVTSHLPSR
jgi:hypothetical protein